MATRKTLRNIPNVDDQSLMADEAKTPAQVRYPRGSGNTDHLHPEKEQRNRDLNPHPVRRGKDAQDWTDLVLNAPPLYIQQQAHTGCPG